MIKDKFVGIWKLNEMYTISNGKKWYPMGKNLVGRIIYFANNQMSAQGQGLDSNGADFADETSNISKYLSGNYFGYFGTYTIDEAAGIVIHKVEGSVVSDMIGRDMVRLFSMHDNILQLSARTENETSTLIWEKI